MKISGSRYFQVLHLTNPEGLPLPFCQCKDLTQVTVHMLHNCLRGKTRETTKMGVGDCDILEAKLMQSQKEPHHLCRWADPIILVCGEVGQVFSEMDGERLVWFGCAVVLRNIFCKSSRHVDLQCVDLTTVRYRKKNRVAT